MNNNLNLQDRNRQVVLKIRESEGTGSGWADFIYPDSPIHGCAEKRTGRIIGIRPDSLKFSTLIRSNKCSRETVVVRFHSRECLERIARTSHSNGPVTTLKH